jgi:hypothetical protein
MNKDKNWILFAMSIVLVLSIIGELYALYTGKFPGNKIPMPTYIYNITLVVSLVVYSNTEEKIKIKKYTKSITGYVPTNNSNLKKRIEEIAEKYYIQPKEADNIDFKVPDTEEIKIVPSKFIRFDSTMDFDDNMIQAIKEQRYKWAAEHMNTLQNK